VQQQKDPLESKQKKHKKMYLEILLAASPFSILIKELPLQVANAALIELSLISIRRRNFMSRI
jgi:hypothetical protein